MNSKEMLDAAKRFDTPYYLFDEAAFNRNYDALIEAFTSVYPNYQLAYSYKTNYTPYICNLVKERGGYAEVVSDMELELAERLGYESSKIIYNGPVKGPKLQNHVLSGGINNIDNYEEALAICEIADANRDKAIEVGIRINLDLGRSFKSRFGLSPNSDDLHKVINKLSSCENISIVGIHCHIGHHRDLDAWRKRAEIMLQVSDQLFDGSPKYIGLGSGMFGDLDPSLARQFGCEIPTYADYAEAVLAPMADRFPSKADQPIVFTEPGATVVSAYMSFVATVHSVKSIGDRTIAAVDGSAYNLGSICKGRQLPTTLIKSNQDEDGFADADIVGYTCLEDDVLYEKLDAPISTGDRIVFGNVGGYSIVCKPPFIQGNCPMYTVDKSGAIRQIMRRESFEDVFNKFSTV